MKINEIILTYPTLFTERLVLRKVEDNDVHDINKCGNDDVVTKYTLFPTHRILDISKVAVRRMNSEYERGDGIVFAITLKGENKFIGSIGLHNYDFDAKKAEAAYWLGKEYWGNGYSTEALERVIIFGFEELQLTRIQAQCHPNNIGSEKVMQKVKMSYEGTLRKSYFCKGEIWDTKMYSILKSEY